jgi:hypothetical protein
MRLASVFDHRNAVPLRKLHERRHIAGIAVEVDRQECFGPRSHSFRDRLGGEIQRLSIDIGEDGPCPGSADSQCGEGGGQRAGDDFIPRPNSERPKRKR